MDRLWAPWRIKYVRSKIKKRCIFCNTDAPSAKNYIILKTEYSTARLNTFPYNNGHIMVSPIRHIAEFGQLDENEVLDIFKTLNKVKELLDKVLKPHGYNIGINITKSAGAGIASHLHIHIVPRWLGDTNFMPALFDTKVISQSLEELYKRLKDVKPKKD
jgi:ATP adenylyltransferase